MLKTQKNVPDSMRLDKWLWCARFYKTRQLALDAIKAGRVKMEGNRVKPSRLITPGETCTIKRGPYVQTITVLALSGQRRSPAEAALLYKESEDSIRQREQLQQQLKMNNAMHPRSRGRPTKRDRRKLVDFTRRSEE
jgi:ribosome-associated heat shock protein Hsp15